jgi:hypothetical protein
MRSTVAVVRLARTTRPTRPSALTTVESGFTPASVPASMVTARVKDCAGPIPTTRDGTSA